MTTLVPDEWASRSTVPAGSYEDWVETGFSDHAPVIVDIEDDAPRGA